MRRPRHRGRGIRLLPPRRRPCARSRPRSPSRWAGSRQAWGHETRETAPRLVTGSSAYAEVKCFEATANPYLLAGAVPAAGIAGVAGDLRVPDPVTGDPAARDGTVPRLPSPTAEAAAALAASVVSSAVPAAALGPERHDVVGTARRAGAERCAGLGARALTSAVLWRW